MAVLFGPLDPHGIRSRVPDVFQGESRCLRFHAGQEVRAGQVSGQGRAGHLACIISIVFFCCLKPVQKAELQEKES